MPTAVAMTDVRALMSAYCDGDAHGFRALHAIVAPRLFAYLSRMTRDRTLAADLVQQTFMKVHSARHTYIRDADPLPWIFAIAHRTFIDETRRSSARVVQLAGSRPLPEPAAAPSEDVLDGERISAALAQLAKLPEPQRQAIVLIKLEGRTVAEAAEIAGISEGAMRVRAHRGYEAIRAALVPSKAT